VPQRSLQSSPLTIALTPLASNDGISVTTIENAAFAQVFQIE
jgi:hypothetical protein